jgi:hypothetical protein
MRSGRFRLERRAMSQPTNAAPVRTFRIFAIAVADDIRSPIERFVRCARGGRAEVPEIFHA